MIDMQQAAQRAVGEAMKAGELRYPTTCCVCGVDARPLNDTRNPPRWTVQYHHWSYLPEHRLDVVPLCMSCHRQVHCGSIPDPTSGARWGADKRLRASARKADWERQRAEWRAQNPERAATIARVTAAQNAARARRKCLADNDSAGVQ